MLNYVKTPRPRWSLVMKSTALALIIGIADMAPWPAAHAQDSLSNVTSGDRAPADLPEDVLDALAVGEPEFGLRLLREIELDAAPPGADDHAAQHIALVADVYQAALDMRLQQRAEGAVMQLLTNAPPPGTYTARSEAALKLIEIWRHDPLPNRQSLERRLRWFSILQRTLQPSPLDAETPITLTLLALDQTDPVSNPVERVLLMDIARNLAPDRPIWQGYGPDEYTLSRAGEQLEQQGKYLAASKIYRRLIYQGGPEADWFQRKDATAQVDRVYARSQIAGADYALHTAALVREEALESTDLGRLRTLKEQLRGMVGEYQSARVLPAELDHELVLDPLPVGYLVRRTLIVRQGGHLIVNAGTIVRGGGTVVLAGGKVTFRGTANEPVLVINVSFDSNDSEGGGTVASYFTQFRDCAFQRGDLKPVEGALRWAARSTFSGNSRWEFDHYAHINWIDSVFEDGALTLAARHSFLGDADSAIDAELDSIRFTHCRFNDVRMDDLLPIRAERSAFVDCEISRWSIRPHDASANLDGETAAPTLVTNSYIPLGRIPAIIHAEARFVDESPPYMFGVNGSRPQIDLGATTRWVD